MNFPRQKFVQKSKVYVNCTHQGYCLVSGYKIVFSLFTPAALQPFDEGQSRASQVASFMAKRILGNSAIPWQGKTPDCHFIDLFISVGPPSPTRKIQPRLKFLALKTSQIVSVGTGIRPQKGQRDNFTREPPCLHQSILGVPVCVKPSLTSGSRRPDTNGSYVTFMPVESTEMSMTPCKDQHLFLVC